MIYHDSQSTEYRSPFGAVECGTQIQLRISVLENNIKNVYLRLWTDSETLIPMERNGSIFTISYTVNENPCLVWYYFIIEKEDGERLYYCNNEENLGGEGVLLSEPKNSFQITVYKKRVTPEWYKRGIIYQIFPDSFSRGKDFQERVLSHLNKKTKLPHLIMTDERDAPFYVKDEKGDVIRWPFYNGTIEGITEKLEYIKSLGADIIYLNPIFMASSSHRYDTADYMSIDSALGDEESFSEFINKANKLGMKVILDGVFSHVGKDSKYFDFYNTFNDGENPYKSWFMQDENGEYSCWWGVSDLPNVNKNSEYFRNYIYKSTDSVVKHWLKKGISGWRLDVADELPDDFIRGIRKAMDETNTDSVLLGEVWEDASNKISYGKLRSYFNGDELNSTMNYPVRLAFIDYFSEKISANMLSRRLMSLFENYPKENFYSAMNLIGSHDRERILTVLNGDKDRLRLLFELQFIFPGVPSIYYGDEAGMLGGKDPENRAFFPWDNVDNDVMGSLKFASGLRTEYEVLKSGDFYCENESDVFKLIRKNDTEAMLYYINLGEASEVDISEYVSENARAIELHSGKVLESNKVFIGKNASLIIYVINDFKAFDYGKKRGILCHISSLPGKYGCGTLGIESKNFIDELARKNYNIWQFLPLTVTGDGDSPYYSPSVFAGNELLLSPDALFEEGLISEKDLKAAELEIKDGRLNFPALKIKRKRLYEKAFHKFVPNEAYYSFIENNKGWLKDHALFMALRKHYSGIPWTEWDSEAREHKNLEFFEKKLKKDVDYEYFLQFEFDKQLSALKSYANSKGVALFGDLPIYVAHDSADVWANRSVFDLDSYGLPNSAAGVPPDYFDENGQYWGNPLYLWEEASCKEWWKRRLRQAFKHLDFVRLDHFRGFEAFWVIAKGEKTGKNGVWKKGPGIAFFKDMEKEFGKLPIIAEDLGIITPLVNALRNSLGFLGMYTYQFSSEYMFNDKADAESRVFYTGTHDNNTLVGWLKESGLTDEEAFTEAKNIIKKLDESDSAWKIFPIQDIKLLDSSARMNIPGTVGNNWNYSANSIDL